MATDYAEKERVFIASLEADTGRALAAWMQAIAESGCTNRNDIIDWLRQSGFTFSNASWLERIHHNGGRLVYADDVPPPLSPVPPRPAAARTKDAPPPLPDAPEPAEPPHNGHASADPAATADAAAPLIAAAPVVLSMTDAAAEVLLAAKGLRPLASLALQQIASAVPETAFTADGPLLILAAPRPYLALLPGAKMLRFYGAFGAGKHERVARSESAMKIATKAQPPFPNVLVLMDARLVDETFISLVKLAHAEAQG